MRIQDLSEGCARFISEQNNPDLGTKRRVQAKIYSKIDIFIVLH